MKMSPYNTDRAYKAFPIIIYSSFLFAVFGLKMLREGWKMSASEAAEEMEEVQEDLKRREAEAESDSSDVEGGR